VFSHNLDPERPFDLPLPQRRLPGSSGRSYVSPLAAPEAQNCDRPLPLPGRQKELQDPFEEARPVTPYSIGVP